MVLEKSKGRKDLKYLFKILSEVDDISGIDLEFFDNPKFTTALIDYRKMGSSYMAMVEAFVYIKLPTVLNKVIYSYLLFI